MINGSRRKAKELDWCTEAIKHVMFEGDHIQFGIEASPVSFISDLNLNARDYYNAQGCLLQYQEVRGAAIPALKRAMALLLTYGRYLALAYACFTLCLGSTAFADVTLKQYRGFLKIGPEFTNYILGVGRGVFWANTILGVSGQKPMFCMPGKLNLDKGIILSLIDQEIRSPSSGKKWEDDTPIEMIMVLGFMDRFPCQ